MESEMFNKVERKAMELSDLIREYDICSYGDKKMQLMIDGESRQYGWVDEPHNKILPQCCEALQQKMYHQDWVLKEEKTIDKLGIDLYIYYQLINLLSTKDVTPNSQINVHDQLELLNRIEDFYHRIKKDRKLAIRANEKEADI